MHGLGLISAMPAPLSPYDEMLEAGGVPRGHCRHYYGWLREQPAEHLARKRAEADALFHRVGITFAVYGENAGTERLIPFDIVPRILPGGRVARARGRAQAARAGAERLRRRHLPRAGHPARRASSRPSRSCAIAQYRPEMQGVDVPGGIYAHIAGIDVVRDDDGSFCVLEDNLRVPSGVSYMLENRKMMMRLFPELFAAHAVEPVEHYPDVLLENLKSVAPDGRHRSDRGAAHARAPTTAPISSTPSSPSRWASSWSRARTCSCATTSLYMRTTQGPRARRRRLPPHR